MRTPAGTRGRSVLDGAFALLDALEQTSHASLARLVAISGLPKATAYRLLEQMIALGAVERRGRGYRIGPRTFRLGQAWQPYPALRNAAHLPAWQLANVTRALVTVTVPADGKMMVIAEWRGPDSLTDEQRLGTYLPMRSAAGTMAAAADTKLGVPDGYSPAAWRRRRAAVSETGVATAHEQVTPGVSCVAAPIVSATGEVAAISAAVASNRRLDHIVEAIPRFARVISENLRYG